MPDAGGGEAHGTHGAGEPRGPDGLGELNAARRHARLKELVFLASRLEGAERARLLERECAGDDALRREAVSILESSIPTGDVIGPLDRTAGGARPGPATSLPPKVGAYRLGRELGRGGMGLVLEAVDERTGEQVAVKILHPGLVLGDGSVDRFAREARVGASITHGGVVRTLDAGTDVADGSELHWLVMERVEGRTLRALVSDLGAVPEGLLREIARQGAAALAAIHAAGVVHRDLKPENILITDDQRIRIMDLGVAKLAAETLSLTREGQFLGSVSHAAPEQIEGREIGPPADLYAFGVTLHELASGANPFLKESMGATLRAHLDMPPPELPSLSPFLADVITTLLQKSPDQRFADAETLHRALTDGEASAWWRARLARHAATPARIPVARAVPLVGRVTELAMLASAWRSAREGAGAAVLLTGEAGIGKTRLLAELADIVARDSALVLHASLARGDGACPFGAALPEALGDQAAMDARSRLARWPAMADAVGSLASGDMAPHEVAPELLGIGFARWLQSIAEDRPVAWFLDDAHAASPEAAAIVRALAAAAREHPALIVVSGRAEGEAPWLAPLASDEAVRRMELERLERREVETLAELFLASREMAHRLGPRLALRSDGVPGFALALLRSLVERGALRRDGSGGWRLDEGALDIGLPPAARDAARARLAVLSREAREILDAASVQGFSFDAELVSDQLDRPLVRVLQELADLERRHEIVRSEGRFHAFDGRVLLEVLSEELPEMLRRAHHEAIARGLAARIQSGRAADGRESAEISAHFLRGRKPESAVPFLRRALEHLGTLNMHRELVEMANLALEIGDPLSADTRAVTLLRLAHSLGVLGLRDEERSASELALHLAEQVGDPAILADACLARGLQHFALAETEESVAWLQRAAATARVSGDPRVELRASRNLATALARLGQLEEGEALHEWCRSRARELGDALTESMSSVNLGALRINMARFADAIGEYTRGAELARQAGDVRIEAHAEGGLGLALLHLGRRDEAHVHALRQAELSREIGDRRSESLGMGTAGMASMERGRLSEALSLLSRAVELTESYRDPRGISIATGNLASAKAHLGDFESARALLTSALELSRRTGQRLIEASHLLRQAQFDELDGDFEAMLASARAAREGHGERDSEGLAQAFLLEGEALQLLGRPEEARASLRRALELTKDMEAPALRVAAALQLAELPGREGLDAAIAQMRQHESHLGVSDRILARRSAWKSTGDAAHLSRAHELLEYLRAHAPAAWREAMVERHPARAEIARAWRESQR